MISPEKALISTKKKLKIKLIQFNNVQIKNVYQSTMK